MAHIKVSVIALPLIIAMPMFSSSLLAMVKPSISNTSNHTLVSRTRIASDPVGAGYPYGTTVRRWKISGLFGGLRYAASVDVEAFHGSFVIEADDPSANGFTGRLAGGGTRADIYGTR